MRRRRRRKDDSNENLDRWLLTYADMITLLLALFIVMYSMSQIDAKRFGKMAEALNGILRGGHSILDRYDEEQLKRGHGILKLGDLRMIQQVIDEEFKEKGRSDDIITEVTERGLVVHMVESALFKTGSSFLEPQGKAALDMIADRLNEVPNHVRIEGHTDDRPINTPRFPSNWELSSARATEVVRYLIDVHGVPPEKVSALGYGKFRPIRPNNSIENRARNRRIDVVILTMDLSLKEPSSQLYELAETEPSVP